MKRNISLLLILALVISIGGVYATWGYAQGAITSAVGSLDVGEGKNIVLADAVATTSAGTITIDVDDVSILVDDTNNDHVADVLYSGDIVITFEPSAGADAGVVENGIPMNLSIVMGSVVSGQDWEYDGVEIFALASDFDGSLTGAAKGSDGKFTYTFGADEWKDWFVFNGDQVLVLDTMSDWNNFHTALHNGMISLTVSDARP